MEEISQEDMIFKTHPDKVEAQRSGNFSFYDIGEGYIGVGEVHLARVDSAYGILLAYDGEGNVIFRGGLDYYSGIAALGQSSGSFQRAFEHRGHHIGTKMALIGLSIMKDFIQKENLPLNEVALKTDPQSSMAKIAASIGMTDQEQNGHFRMTEIPPNIQERLDQVGITKLS